jgi:UDP-N-acetylglucosamine 2-epimerase (non-hydrolysing)
MLTVLSVIGTRPEAIKMAPVIKALEAHPHLIRSVVCSAGQHREMLNQVLELFGIVPDYALDLMQANQRLPQLTADLFTRLDGVFDSVGPDWVLAQGDTTTVFVAAMGAFYRRIRFGHVEAGLRTGDLYSPFPEEANRRFVSAIAARHCAPTESAARNLYVENVRRADVVVTGNTVIDALLHVAPLRARTDDPVVDEALRTGRRIVLVTAHRRESWDTGIGEVAAALVRIANLFPDVLVVLPMHRNPLVRTSILPAVRGVPNIHLTEPLGYGAFSHVLSRATVALTDSGGVQEEAPALDVPVVVTRDTTERPEVVQAGGAVLVGTDQSRIVRTLRELLTDEDLHQRMAKAPNPFGDGRAAERVVDAVADLFEPGRRTPAQVPVAVGL